MDPAKVSQWLRFRDQVLQKQGWPREMWFTALEDGLHAAFGDDAPVLADFRRDRAELLRLEGRASGSYQDAQRITQLEAQIRQLVDRADRSVTAGQTDAVEPDPVASLPAAALAAVPALAVPAIARAQPWRARAAMMAAGSVLVALGVGGASLYYETRLSALADQQIAQIDRLLDQRVAGLRAELEQQLASGSGKDSAVAGELRARTTALGGALDELSLEVSSLEMRLPALDKELNKISASAGRMAQELTRTGSEVDRLKTATPELRAWLAQQKEELENGVQGGRDTLGGITGRVQSLAGEVDQSRALLVNLNHSLVQGLEQARQDGAALQTAVEQMQATGLEVAKLMEGAETRVQAAHDAMQVKIDTMLSDLAEQADLAVLRGGDVVRRAEGEVARRVDAASEAALETLTEERMAKLAALTEQVSKTQQELEQTRAGLLESWQRMDQSVAERQSEVLTSLDAYAGTIGVRVEELLEALDLMVARSGG